MTPTATYLAEENCLQEISQMEKPRKEDYQKCVAMPFHEIDCYTSNEFYAQLSKYEKHLASLRRIPCDPSCKGLWADGQKVVVGKDYEVKECRTWTQKGGEWGCAECCNKDAGCDEDCDATYYRPNCPFCKGKGWFKEQPLFAFPLVPVKSEDELWHKAINLIMAAHDKGLSKEDAVGVVKSQFIITKR